jgi:hypothetical protein
MVVMLMRTANLVSLSRSGSRTSFDEAAQGLRTIPFIADIVFQGVAKANAVIALFTPAEQAALFFFNGP